MDKKEDCTPCAAGEKQNPFTCACKSYTKQEIGCPARGTFDKSKCECSWTNIDGKSKTKAAKCKYGFAPSSDCSTCDLKSEFACKAIKCPIGQGWDKDNCKCATHPTCPVNTVTTCEFGQLFDPMTCKCVDPETIGKKVRGGGSKTGKLIFDKEKFMKPLKDFDFSTVDVRSIPDTIVRCQFPPVSLN